MFLKLFISGGVFDLDPKYTDEDVRLALALVADAEPVEVSFDLRYGGSVQSHVTRSTEWSLTSYAE